MTAALEVRRADKTIGASLEAAPVVHVEDAALLKALRSVDFADVIITSAVVLTGDVSAVEYALKQVTRTLGEMMQFTTCSITRT